MFEIDQYEDKRHTLLPLSPITMYECADNIHKLSLLFWGEHCTECAAPACYETCHLFEARPDTRCRRFLYGIYRNRTFPSFRGYGAEVSFKKWGVFASAGNTSMAQRWQLLWAERVIGLIAPVINTIGPLVSRLTRDDRWTYPVFGLSRRLCAWLHKRGGPTKPDAFLLEVFNPADPVRVQLAMDYAPDGHNKSEMVQIRPRFRTTLEITSGYSRHELDHRLFQTVTDSGLPFNISITPEADTAPHLVFLSADFITYKRKPKKDSELQGIKCVVWDLDHTIWDGTLVETDDVHLRPNVKELLRTFDDRGILSSIASKNNHEAAWERLESFGIAEYFVYPQIHWKPKSGSVKTIAKRLNIGLDAIAFVDDNPFELNEVSAAIPEVLCLDAARMDELFSAGRFQGSKTADAQNRRRYYQEAIVREEKQAEFGADYVSFLRYCEIRLEIAGYRAEDLDRVSELAQRTNQLNFSGYKYAPEQVRELLVDPSLEKYVLFCSDRFGSYGLIGFGLVRNTSEELRVQDLMLSCRVQGKLVESAFLSHIELHHNPYGARRLFVNFRQTARNQPAHQVLEASGFKPVETGGVARAIVLQPNPEEHPVRVKCLAGCEQNGTTSGLLTIQATS